jgi:hypothetical protein
MRIQAVVTCAALALSFSGCFTGGTPALDHCKVDVVGLEDRQTRPDGIDVFYRVRGDAGSPGTTWLVAQDASGTYIPGYGVDVGPGPFEAIVDLKLTGLPRRFIVVLEVAGKRCRDDAPMPSR